MVRTRQRERFSFDDGLGQRKSTGTPTGSDLFKHVRCRLNGFLTNVVHTDGLTAVLARDYYAASGVSGRGVYTSSLRSIAVQCGALEQRRTSGMTATRCTAHGEVLVLMLPSRLQL